MKRSLYLFWASHLALAACLSATGLAQGVTQNPQQWRDDLAYLAQELPRRHINAFHSISSDNWYEQVAALHEAIPALPDYAIIVRLTQLLVLIGDQHTSLSWTSPQYAFRRYPLLLINRPDGVFVQVIAANRVRTNRGVVSNRHLVNTRVVQIGGVNIEIVKQRAASLVAQDSPYSLTNPLTPLLVIPEVLHELGIVRDMAHGMYTWVDAAGQWYEVDLSPYPASELSQIATFTRQHLLRWSAPLYYTRPSSQFYWYEYLPQQRAVYFCYARCAEMAELPFATFSRELLNFLNSHSDVEKLIIELRGNPGGSSAIFDPFIESLRANSRFNQSGRLFVLIDNSVYSGGVWAASGLQLRTNAILIGEPTGGRPNMYGNVQPFTLPHSGLTVNHVTRYFRIRPNDDPIAVFPNLTVPYPWSVLLASRDPVLEAALNY